jgi:hypothetical protein
VTWTSSSDKNFVPLVSAMVRGGPLLMLTEKGSALSSEPARKKTELPAIHDPVIVASSM